jgi:tripeptidyl-peptidase-1
MLDIETITGISGNVDSEFWGFAGRSPDNAENEPFMKWLAQVSSTGDDTIPKIFSTSYGEDENSWSLEAATRLNTEFQKAGARGISLLYASGDEGANCKSGKFVPEGPGSSPYVTSVGGTEPSGSWPAPGGETAVGLSSGGFSNYWDMPDWQKDAVAKYLTQSGLPDQSQRAYNTSGRAYPDISAQAMNFVVVDHGIPLPGVAGTSCASPTAAGIFSLVNDARMQAGKSSLGFLNPFIYENAASFNDITTGSGSGCGLLSSNGWPAKEGWDAVTGVGTPDYAKLASASLALPGGKASVVV